MSTLNDIDETLRLLVDGLRMQAAVLGHHGEMLSQILAAVADRDEPTESPLLSALQEIFVLLSRHAGSLDRIEGRLANMERARPDGSDGGAHE